LPESRHFFSKFLAGCVARPRHLRAPDDPRPCDTREGFGDALRRPGNGKDIRRYRHFVASATGSKFLKWQAPKPRNVLHCDGEMAAVDLRQRLAPCIEASAARPLPGMLNIRTADLIGVWHRQPGFAQGTAGTRAL